MIHVTPGISIRPEDIELSFVASSGPGGQNVNKVATAVQLRFNIAANSALSPPVKQRLKALAGKRATEEGILIIDARRYRSQHQNRQDAVARLIDLIRRAAVRPARRIKTHASRGSKERRLQAKRRRSQIKDSRRTPSSE